MFIEKNQSICVLYSQNLQKQTRKFFHNGWGEGGSAFDSCRVLELLYSYIHLITLTFLKCPRKWNIIFIFYNVTWMTEFCKFCIECKTAHCLWSCIPLVSLIGKLTGVKNYSVAELLPQIFELRRVRVFCGGAATINPVVNKSKQGSSLYLWL